MNALSKTYSALSLMIIFSALASCAQTEEMETVNGLGDPISGEFQLTNYRNQPTTEESYDGKYRLVFFGFTYCPDICPTTLSNIGKALSTLGDQASSIKPLFISVDHERDTPERLAQYVAYFHPSIDGLTGTEAQIKEAAKNFNTTYGKQRTESSSDWYHSSYIFLLDKDGQLIDVFSHSIQPDALAKQLQTLAL